METVWMYTLQLITKLWLYLHVYLLGISDIECEGIQFCIRSSPPPAPTTTRSQNCTKETVIGQLASIWKRRQRSLARTMLSFLALGRISWYSKQNLYKGEGGEASNTSLTLDRLIMMAAPISIRVNVAMVTTAPFAQADGVAQNRLFSSLLAR